MLIALLLAYNEAIHAQITRAALPDAAVVQPAAQKDLDDFRALFWRRASARHPGFARRFPTPASFDSWAFKEFLMLNPAARVHGFDLYEEKPMPRVDLLAAASRWPDDDKRNQDRFFRDARRELVKAGDGSPMPYDPATLDFGGLSGPTSQGHAHYGIVEGPLSDDPEVLKKDPRRFAVPPTAHAYGREFAQLYTDLAGLAENEALSATFAGAAFHHIEDVCNQIHTVQVGIYEFFESAFLQSKLRDVKTLGGLLGERYSLKRIGLRLIANHHLMSEDLFAKHHQGTPGAGPGLGIGELIDASSQEGPQVYRLAWTFSAATLRDGVNGHEYESNKDDPDRYVDASKSEALQQFHDLEERGLRRAVGAVRAWRKGDHDPVPELIAYHEQAEQRRARYAPASPQQMGIAWGYPAAAAALLVLAGAAIWSRLSKRS